MEYLDVNEENDCSIALYEKEITRYESVYDCTTESNVKSVNAQFLVKTTFKAGLLASVSLSHRLN